jgi:hypothetical protein
MVSGEPCESNHRVSIHRTGRTILGYLRHLKSPIEKIKNKESPDEGHQQLLDNIITTIRNATDFMIQFWEKRAIFQILRRNDYKEDFKTFHEEVSQHVGDLNLSETVIVGEELQAAIKSAEKADEEHLQDLLEGMMEQLNDNHHEQTNLMKEMQEGFGIEFKSVRLVKSRMPLQSLTR